MKNPALFALATLSVLAAAAAACLGDDPVPTSPTDDAGAANPDAAGTQNDAQAGQDAGSDTGSPASCGARDTSPCGCGGGKTCCPLDDGGAPCFDQGKEDSDDGCSSSNILRCVGGTCGGGRACCFVGTVTPGATCPLRMTRYSTECVDIDTTNPASSCTDTSNGIAHHFMCEVDADCTQFDAGTCQSAQMDALGRIMGVCSH